MKRLRADPFLITLLVLSLWAVMPLTAPGFFLKAHDATHSIYFLWQFDAALRDGAWIPRWAMDWTFGYGYPVFLVIAPLAYYLASLFHALGADLITAIKLVYGLAMILAGVTGYLLVRDWLGRPAGVLAGLVYVYTPFHLADIYVRGDLAEFVALAWLPAILWATGRALGPGRSGQGWGATPQPSSGGQDTDMTVAGGQDARAPATIPWVGLAGLFYGGLILTHIVTAIIFTPLLIAYGLWLVVNTLPLASRSALRLPSLVFRLLHLTGVGLIGLLVGAIFWLPGVLEQRYLKLSDLAGGYFQYVNHFVYPFQLFSPFWGYGYAGVGPKDGMSFQLGVVPVVLGILGIGYWGLGIGGWRQRRNARHFLLFFAGAALILTLAMLPEALSVWDVLKPLATPIQFPWRLLGIVALPLAVLAGGLIARDGMTSAVGATAAPTVHPDTVTPPITPGLTVLLILLTLLASYPYTTPQYTEAEASLSAMIDFSLKYKELLGDTIWVKEKVSEGSPLVAQYLAGQPPLRATVSDPGAAILESRAGGASYAVRLQASQETTVHLLIRYFPGWQATVDDQPVALAPEGDLGLMSVRVPAGEHWVRLRYGGTTIQHLGEILSLIGLGVVIILVLAHQLRH